MATNKRTSTRYKEEYLAPGVADQWSRLPQMVVSRDPVIGSLQAEVG